MVTFKNVVLTTGLQARKACRWLQVFKFFLKAKFQDFFSKRNPCSALPHYKDLYICSLRMDAGVFGSPHAASPPGSFSMADWSPTTVNSSMSRAPPLGECTVGGDRSALLKLPVGGLSGHGDPNMPTHILNVFSLFYSGVRQRYSSLSQQHKVKCLLASVFTLGSVALAPFAD